MLLGRLRVLAASTPKTGITREESVRKTKGIDKKANQPFGLLRLRLAINRQGCLPDLCSGRAKVLKAASRVINGDSFLLTQKSEALGQSWSAKGVLCPSGSLDVITGDR